MSRTYSVMQDEQCIGIVKIDTVGLYYRISCVCDIRNDFCYLFAKTDTQELQLGLMVPSSEGLTYHGLVSQKKLSGALKGFLVKSRGELQSFIIPLEENKMFPDLKNIKVARLHRKKGNYYIVLGK